MSTDILLLVEDPGAANMLVGVPAALADLGLACRTLARGHGAERLADLGIDHDAAPDDAGTVLDQFRPAAVAVGCAEDPEALGLRLIHAARRRAIASAALVDGPSNPAHRFRGAGTDPLAHVPDRLLVPDAATADLFRGLGLKAEAMTVTGHPHFDAVHEVRASLDAEGRATVRARTFPGIAADRPLLLFAAEISDGHDPGQFRRDDAYTLSGRGGSDARTDIVLEEVMDALARLAPRPALVVRLHPKNTSADFAAHGDAIDGFSAGGLPFAALYAADGVVGMTSMVMWEAALLGRPALAVVPRAVERDWLSAIGLGVVPAAATRQQVRTGLADLVAGRLHARPASDVVCFGAARRIAEALADLGTR